MRALRDAIVLCALSVVALADVRAVVETVDAHGQPVGGVPVAYVVHKAGWPQQFEELARVTTDAVTGRAKFERLDELRAEWLKRPTFECTQVELEWRLRVDAFPKHAGDSVEAPTTELKSPIRLSVANLREVEIIAVDAHGQPTLGAAEAAVTFRGPRGRCGPDDVRRSSTWDGAGARQVMITAPLVDGRARIPRIAIVAGCEALVRMNSLSDWTGLCIETAGSAETQLVRVEAGRGLHRMSLRLALEESAGEVIQLRARLTSPTVQEFSWGDADHRFRAGSTTWSDVLDLDEGTMLLVAPWTAWQSWSRDGAGEFVFERSAARMDETEHLDVIAQLDDGSTRRGLLDLTHAKRKRVLDLVLSAQVATPVRGLVVDQLGAPIAGAQVAIGRVRTSIFPLDPERDDRLNLESAVTDAYGSFEWPAIPAEELRITARAPEFLEGFRDIAPPMAEPVRIELRRRLVVRGYLRVSESIGVFDLNIVLIRENSASRSTSSGVSVGCSCDGLFEFRDLEPGRFTLVVRRAHRGAQPGELLRMENLTLEKGHVLDLGELRIE